MYIDPSQSLPGFSFMIFNGRPSWYGVGRLLACAPLDYFMKILARWYEHKAMIKSGKSLATRIAHNTSTVNLVALYLTICTLESSKCNGSHDIGHRGASAAYIAGCLGGYCALVA